MTELNCFGTGNICIVLWCAFKWSNWPETPANSTNFILRNDFPASSHSRPILLNPDICPFDWSSPRLSVSSACFRSSMLFSPIISLSSPHLLLPTPFFSLPAFSCSSTSPFLHKPILQSVLSFTLSFPVSPFIPPLFFFFGLFCISHLLSGFHSMLFRCLSPPSLPPYTSISASISGAHTADGGGPLSPLREQKVCPLPLRLCVMEHREIETEESEQMGGGHTGCLFYNITPNNAVVISVTM